MNKPWRHAWRYALRFDLGSDEWTSYMLALDHWEWCRIRLGEVDANESLGVLSLERLKAFKAEQDAFDAWCLEDMRARHPGYGEYGDGHNRRISSPVNPYESPKEALEQWLGHTTD